jgi:hypothetical protein
VIISAQKHQPYYQPIQLNPDDSSNLNYQFPVADPYSWSYKVTTGDHNYKDRHDKKFDLLYYDWDQNKDIEKWYQFLLKNPSKHKTKVEM